MVDRSEIITYSVVGIVAGIIMFFRSFKRRKLLRIIDNLPTSKIRSLAIGRVEIQGKIVKPKEPITAPFSHTNCSYCRWEIWEWRSSGKSGRWVKAKSGTLGKSFHVKDDTGKIMVDSHDCELIVKPKFNSNTVSKDAEEFVNSHLGFTKFGIFKRRLKFMEYYLEPGDNVYVLGEAVDNPFVEDGTSRHGHEDLIIRGKKKDFFLISDKSEKEVLKKLAGKTNLMLFGGMALIVGGAAVLFFMFGIL